METKREIKFFSIFAWQEEEAWLREQHRAGWKLTDIHGLGSYHFERCEAEDVIYRLDYNPEGLSNRDEYVTMFHDCGWEYVMEYMGYSYVRRPAEEAEGQAEIFCDDESRLAMLRRVYKGRLGIMAVIFFAVLLPQFTMQMDGRHPAILVLYGVLVGINTAIFGYSIIYYLRYRNGH